ncbi:MAG TPA: STAS domain-containing protein [Vicinamibacterales bacterium]|jgi:anti-sigma B factor antagonist|nr:STAS domain-containing protein [Vicinamibacterales bacterium]
MTPISALVLSDGTLVLRPTGPVTITAESDAGLIAAFDEAIANGQLRIVLDLSETTQMDSAGLAALVRGWIRVKRARGDVALAGPAPSIKTMLTITRLITIFKVSETVDESLELLLP